MVKKCALIHKSILLTRNLLLAAVALICCMCGRTAQKAEAGPESGPELMEEASLLRIKAHDGYEEVAVYDGSDSTHVLARYFLVPDGGTSPAGADSEGVVLHVPLKSLVVDSEVYISALKELGAVDIVKGVFDAGYVTDPVLKAMLSDGRIGDMGSAGSPANEKIMALRPDAVMVGHYPGMSASGIERLGFPIIRMTDIGELSPLGRAEWIRFIGRLCGEGERADSVFREVKRRYASIASATLSGRKGKRPKVMLETTYQGVWYMAGGASYQARFISDAGGEYIYADDTTPGSLSLTFEQVLEKGRDADVWIIKSFGADMDKRGLLASDSRYSAFRPLREGGVYVCDTSVKPLYLETPFHPDLLLADYAAIFRGADSGRYFSRMK